MNSFVQASNLSIGYDNQLIPSFSFDVSRGDCISVMGANGCGKSTLLKTISGLLPSIGGKVFIGSQDISQIPARELAFLVSVVLTQPSNLKNFNVLELIKLGRIPYQNVFGHFRKKDWHAVDQSIDQLGLEDLKSIPFENLSDGQKQKVMIARALTQDTPVLILDEPTTYLDIGYRIELMSLLKEIAEDRKMVVIYSSHDWDLVLAINTLLWLIMPDGSMKKGMPEELLTEGHVEKVFGGEHFRLDMNSGQFQRIYSQDYPVSLFDSKQQRYNWTKQALNKRGFYLKSDAEIKINASDNGWDVDLGEKQLHAESLSELLNILNS